jgi:hypothetical protein
MAALLIVPSVVAIVSFVVAVALDLARCVVSAIIPRAGVPVRRPAGPWSVCATGR